VYTDAVPKVTERWDLRVATETDELVRRAAEASEKTLTEFVRDAAALEADRILADRTQVELPRERWTRFVEMLDRPPQENPGLRKLFARSNAFADQT
jgi:uncharacterized protein (DUF1778 family)